MLIVYAITLVLRIITSTGSLLVTNNRLLAVTGYLYGLLAMLLALRTFGHMLEAPRNMGTILIAFFRITQNLGSILCQFMAVIVAFSLPIAKIYITERFYVQPSNDTKPLACDDSDGLSCWWLVVTHLGWSVLGMPDIVLLESVDAPSVILAQALYGIFLILGVILLVNMMIALLSNTYQQVEDNSLTEWSFKKAVTIQTYSVYHWVPVPFNILSLLARVLYTCLEKKCKKTDDEKQQENDEKEGLNGLIEDLEDVYFATHGRSFPLRGDLKTERLLQECHGNRRMSNQIARHVFIGRSLSFHESQSGSDAWDSSGIEVEGCLLTCKGSDICDCHEFHNYRHGARYTRAFTAENPRIEVVIQEEGKSRKLAVGVVYENYGRHWMPGWFEGTVGYHADDGLIMEADKQTHIKDAMAHRGDQMACEVDFSRKDNETHTVPVMFFLNGKHLHEASMKTVDENGNETKLFPHIGMGTKESQVLVQICPSPRKAKTANEKRMHQPIAPAGKVSFESAGKEVTLGTIQEHSEDWESAGIEIEGCQMTCRGSKICRGCQPMQRTHGARYKLAFTADNPRMEVLVQNEGKKGDLAIGVVYENYDHHWMPGECKGTVGYHADNGIINRLDREAKKIEDTKAHQEDLMACEVDFIRANNTADTVPVMFFLNGRYIGEADMKTVDEDGNKTNLFPYIGMGSEGIQVDVQMCPSLRRPRINEAQRNVSPASSDVTANTLYSGVARFYETSSIV